MNIPDKTAHAFSKRSPDIATHRANVELSVVVPTFKESENVAELVRLLELCMGAIAWEVIFVDDDSPDETAERVRQLSRVNPRVRVIHRVGRRGLSSACIEGMLSSAAPFVAVMDADLQHDEKLLPDMLRALQEEKLDIVVGSRYVEGGGLGNWDTTRASISRFATQLSKLVLKADLSDPMSGFFMIRHEALLSCLRAGVSGIGFKILLDLFAAAPQPLRFKELPYEFRTRHAGESKLDSTVAWEYLMMLLDRMFGRAVPVRFIAFALVGAIGVLIHLVVLAIVFQGAQSSFLVGQSIATLVAMTGNFFMNNVLTYRDMRLKGWGLLRGWASFVVACSIGAFANVGIAEYFYQRDTFWMLSAIAGILVGAVWNYAVTAVYTWGKKK